MRKDKDKALKLRLSGKSYAQISRALNVPKSTLSTWLKDIALSKKAKSIIESRGNAVAIKKLIARNKNQTVIAKNLHQTTYKIGKEEARTLINDPLFIAGISLYWAEGYKKGWEGSAWKSIDFANSDAKMIKLMLLFFKKFLQIKIQDIRVQIMLHDKNNIKKSIKYWQKITKIPKKNFFKPYCSISKSSHKKRQNKLEYGTIHIRINNIKGLFRLAGWIDVLKNEFI